MKRKFILASSSPRRRELLELLDIEFEIDPSNTEEIFDLNISSIELVQSLALQKAKDVSLRHPGEYVLGFDTLVVLDEHPLGKPKNDLDAYQMLKSLSNRKHLVLTGVAIVKDEYQDVFYDYAEVIFNKMSDEEIHEYIATKEPMDKAGAYGIQGYGARYIKYIKGDYYSVMGLPIMKLYNKIKGL